MKLPFLEEERFGSYCGYNRLIDQFFWIECLKGEVADKGFGGCTKGSQAPSGTIVVKFSADKQVAVVALVPNPNRYSKVKLTCSDVTTTNIYTVSLILNSLALYIAARHSNIWCNGNYTCLIRLVRWIELQKSAKIAATTDSPVTEMKQTQVVIVSTAATSKATCSWEALA